jgi:hypothetical protein
MGHNVGISIVQGNGLINCFIYGVNVEEANTFRISMIRSIFADLEVINLFVDCWATWEFIVAMWRP